MGVSIEFHWISDFVDFILPIKGLIKINYKLSNLPKPRF